MMRRKSISHWWSILADNYLWLLGNNTLYLLCIAPAVICAFLFSMFHAYLFLLLAILLFIPAGPAILAVQGTAFSAALEQPGITRTKFLQGYWQNRKKGAAFGIAAALLAAMVALPVSFAFFIDSTFLGIIVFCGCFTLLLWYSCSTQLIMQLGQRKPFDQKEFLRDVFSSGAVSVMFGAIKLAWVLFCVFAPSFAVTCALVGVPALIRYSELYFLYNEGETNA